MFKKIVLTIGFLLFSTNLFAAQTQIAQVNGMICIKCQKMVTEALQKACPDATVNVCLLYTSPSPRDQVVSRMPSSA